MTKPFLKRFYENTKIFLPLGYTSFGGPNAHIGILHNLLVEKHGWLNDQTFSELYSICQALPGPSSTQLAYSLGVVHDGFLIGIWDFLLWSIPMGVVMALIGLVVARQSTLDPDHEFPLVVIYLTQGLASAAIGLIVLAAYKLHLANAIDSITKIIVFLTASIAILYSAPWLYPILMLASGCFTLFYYLCREKQEPSITSTEHQEENNDQGRIRLPITDEEEGQNGEDTLIQYPITFSGIFFTVWLVLFILAILARFLLLPSATTKEATPLSILSVFYFVGSIIFGGGPVVIPLLQGYTQDWVTSSQFVLGLAIQNSLPGPNFNFATYLGAIALSSNPIGSNVLGALLGFIGIFLPGILLQSAVIPCWQYVRSNQKVKLVFRGVNAAATGLVFSTIWILWNQINQERHNSSESLHFVIAVMTFVLSEQFQVSTPLVVILGGLIGLLEWFLSVYL